MTIRRALPEDLPAIAAIQAASPQAARWDPAEYLAYDATVATVADAVCGFLVCRTVAEGEHEVLNLAVAPETRRKGVARKLMEDALRRLRGAVFLEVRESNLDARIFYITMGFQEISVRPGYYHSPAESGVVMKFHSC